MDNLDYAGIDVSSKTLELAYECNGKLKSWTYPNTESGIEKIAKKLEMKKNRRVRVVSESTGNYGLDLAIRLSKSEIIEFCQANPRAVKQFAGATMTRAKNDAVDARVLLEYARRMKLTKYNPPSEKALKLRTVVRHVSHLTESIIEFKNRLHAAENTKTTPEQVILSINNMIRFTELEIKRLRGDAIAIITTDGDLTRKFDLLQSVPGIAEKTGMQILAEMACMPGNLDVRQLVAMTGLDPVEWSSGRL